MESSVTTNYEVMVSLILIEKKYQKKLEAVSNEFDADFAHDINSSKKELEKAINVINNTIDEVVELNNYSQWEIKAIYEIAEKRLGKKEGKQK